MEFIIAFFKFVFVVVEKTLGFLLSLLEAILGVKPSPSKEGYQSTIGSVSSVASIFNKGFCINGTHAMTLSDSYKNCLLIGSTGTGKSTCVILPTLLKAKPNYSLVITDPSGELLEQSSGYLKEQGFNILTLNFSDSQYSEGYNPLAQIKNEQDIEKIASMLVSNSLGDKKGGDPFWSISATNLLSMCITIIRELEPSYLNLYNVRFLLNMLGSESELIDKLFSRTDNQLLYDEYKSFLSNGEKLNSNIIATAKAAVQIFTNPAVAKVTSIDTLNLQALREKPTALFIGTSVPDQKYFSVLNALFFEQLFGFFMHRLPKENELSCLMLVDEAATVLSRVPTLTTALANLRKYRVGGLYAIQSLPQLFNNYGQHDTESLKANCYAKIFLGGGNQPLETYNELEKTLGRYTQVNKEKGTEKVLPLMAAEQIRTMSSSKGLMICGNKPGILMSLKPHYKNWTLKARSKMPTAVLTQKIPQGKVPTLPLESINDYIQ